jgi:hypothetical protein
VFEGLHDNESCRVLKDFIVRRFRYKITKI